MMSYHTSSQKVTVSASRLANEEGPKVSQLAEACLSPAFRNMRNVNNFQSFTNWTISPSQSLITRLPFWIEEPELMY